MLFQKKVIRVNRCIPWPNSCFLKKCTTFAARLSILCFAEPVVFKTYCPHGSISSPSVRRRRQGVKVNSK